MTGGGLVLLLVGIGLGVLLAVNGFSEPKGGADLKNSQRMRNLGWLVAGAVTTLPMDYKRLNFPINFTPAQAFTTYVEGSVVGAVSALLLISLSIWRSVHSRNEGRPITAKIDVWEVVREYVHYGKEASDTKLDLLDSKSLDKIESKVQEARDIESKISKKLAYMTVAVIAHTKKDPESLKPPLIPVMCLTA